MVAGKKILPTSTPIACLHAHICTHTQPETEMGERDRDRQTDKDRKRETQ